MARDTDDLCRAAAVSVHRQTGIGRSVQGGADFQGASLAGEREPQLQFVPAEVMRQNTSSPPGGYCALAENLGWVHWEPTQRTHFTKRESKTEEKHLLV